MTPVKLIVAALLLPVLILSGAVAAAVWFVRTRRRARPRSAAREPTAGLRSP